MGRRFPSAGNQLGQKLLEHLTSNPRLLVKSLATLLGVSRETVSAWIKTQGEPSNALSAKNCVALSNLLKITDDVVLNLYRLPVALSAEQPPVSMEQEPLDPMFDYPKFASTCFLKRSREDDPYRTFDETCVLHQFISDEAKIEHISCIANRPITSATRLHAGASDETPLMQVEYYKRLYHEPILSYLRERSPTQEDGPFSLKVGLLALRYPDRLRELKLSVCPLPSWFDDIFNRRIVIKHASNDVVRQLCFESWQRFYTERFKEESFDFPSTLFVETCLITNDDYIIFLLKNRKTEIYPLWTCSIDAPFVWNQEIENGKLNVKAVFERAIVDKLGVAEVSEWRCLGIGLMTHLNSAVLGYASLDYTCEDIERKINEEIAFQQMRHFVKCETVHIDAVGDFLTKHERRLHPTAAARVELTLEALRAVR